MPGFNKTTQPIVVGPKKKKKKKKSGKWISQKGKGAKQAVIVNVKTGGKGSQGG